ncbi:10333_t:CDS:1 [Funneliformis geosporum]|nr:10333_t:CDS:1 [Funneliformis geosporum]
MPIITTAIPKVSSTKKPKATSRIKSKATTSLVPTTTDFINMPIPTDNSPEVIEIGSELGKEFVKQVSNPTFSLTHQLIMGACGVLLLGFIITAICVKCRVRKVRPQPLRPTRTNIPTLVIKSPATPLSPPDMAELRERMKVREEINNSN